MSRLRAVRRFRPSYASVAATLALVLALGGFAVAAIPSADGTIRACYSKKRGSLRVVDASKRCLKSERSLKWSQRGPRGLQGIPGAPGTPGTSGAKGDPGPSNALAALLTAGTGLAQGTAGTVPEDTPAKRLITLDVPAGSYDIRLTGRVIQFPGNATVFSCILVAGDDQDYRVYNFNASVNAIDLSHTVTHTFSAEGQIQFRCHSNHSVPASPATSQQLRLVALKVGTLTETGS